MSEKQSRLVWYIACGFIGLEIIFAVTVYYFHGGLSWVGFGVDSIGELTSSLVVTFYLLDITNAKASHAKCGTEPGEHEFHHREAMASENVAYVFYGLAIFNVAWIVLIGEHPPTTTVIWPRIVVMVFTTLTAVMAILKSWQSSGRHDPRWADALQEWVCVASGLIAAGADWLQHRYAHSHLVGDMFIVVLMGYAGYKIQTEKKLCC